MSTYKCNTAIQFPEEKELHAWSGYLPKIGALVPFGKRRYLVTGFDQTVSEQREPPAGPCFHLSRIIILTELVPELAGLGESATPASTAERPTTGHIGIRANGVSWDIRPGCKNI